MTNEVAKSLRGLGLRDRVPQHAAVPDLPPELVRACAMTEGELTDRYLPLPGAVAIEQAVAVIPAYVATDEPVARSAIEGWLDRLMLAVVNPPDPDGHKARMAAIIALSGDLPRMCWTMETWQGFLRRGPDAKFWPGAADVDWFLRPIADQHRAKLATLRRIADVSRAPKATAPEPPEPVSEAARMTAAEISAAVDAIRAKFSVPRRPANDGGEADRTPVPVSQCRLTRPR